jgi:hypothetical protein
LFFERFREAIARLPTGLIRPGPKGDPEIIAQTQSTLGIRLPPAFESFLHSFDGADLFHEAVVVAGVGPGAPQRLLDINGNPRAGAAEPDLMFAEVSGGDRYAFVGGGRVVRIRSGSEERSIAGGDFSSWLDGVVAYHRVLYGPDGEFSPDVFEPDGLEVVPLMALRQAERAVRLCPESAEWHQERGHALRRLGRMGEATQAFARAAALDPRDPWSRFHLGRAALAMGPVATSEAGAAFEAAAELESGMTCARLWVWAARAAQIGVAPERLALCRREALAIEPALATELRRALDAARADGDPDEVRQAEALLEALGGETPGGRVRLPVIVEAAEEEAGGVSAAATAPARRTPRPVPRHPAHATPRRSAGTRGGRSR